MTVDEVPNGADIKNLYKFIYNVLILSISFLSGLILITQYCTLGRTSWAIFTFSFVFFPSVIMQIISIKLYLSSRNMLSTQWLFHSLLLGILHRYIITIKKYVKSYQSKNSMDSNLLETDVAILKNLYLFKSFLECAPQLVLQLYFVIIAPNTLPLTGISVSSSAFSIVWALLIHTKIKRGNDCLGLVFLLLWRVGMIIARISALVLCAYTCGPWTILFIGSHWLAMTLWITYQKAALDDKGEFHSALFGVIYCFCFFSVKTGHSRNKAIILDSLLLLQNLIFLTVFLMSFSSKSPILSVLSFITVTFGSLLGITSFFIYNIFFHPRGPFKCITSPKGSVCCETANCLFNKQLRLPVLTRNRRKSESASSRPENEQLKDLQSPSDSIIIIEESSIQNFKIDGKVSHNPTEETENIYDEPSSNGMEKEREEVKLSAALKRRAICSSTDLTRFLDRKAEDAEMESNRSAKVVDAEGTPSEVLSTHDYENLCAVNIAREPWGIRSWGVYSDIETWRHDDSVFNERRLDNMTTSSEYSGKIEDKDSLNIAEDLLHCEIDTNSDKASVNFVPPFPGSMLHTILEEYESSSDCTLGVEDIKAKCNSESALVATIDKICLYTPLRNRFEPIDNHAEITEIQREPVNKVKDDKLCEESRVKRELRLENETKGAVSPMKEKIRYVHKFNIFMERYETNRYQVCGKMNCSGAQENEVSKLDEQNKENILVETRGGNVKGERNGTKKSFSFKDKSSFLVQMLTPTKWERRSFPISPPKQ